MDSTSEREKRKGQRKRRREREVGVSMNKQYLICWWIHCHTPWSHRTSRYNDDNGPLPGARSQQQEGGSPGPGRSHAAPTMPCGGPGEGSKMAADGPRLRQTKELGLACQRAPQELLAEHLQRPPFSLLPPSCCAPDRRRRPL